jgi:hypothetical protein
MLKNLGSALCWYNSFVNECIERLDRFIFGDSIPEEDFFEPVKHESIHPLPWRVVFKPRILQWHQRSCPVVVDANDVTVLVPQQYVNHPGLRDFLAESICFAIVDNVNKTGCWHFDRYTFD